MRSSKLAKPKSNYADVAQNTPMKLVLCRIGCRDGSWEFRVGVVLGFFGVLRGFWGVAMWFVLISLGYFGVCCW